jgi:N6-adenosine-specific RNA methylase IME4
MKFPIILCDPPWGYNQRAPSTDTKFGGGAIGHYNVTDSEGMAAWKDQFLAMRPESGVMLMWVTGPFDEAAFALMRAWGYTPVKKIFYWVKTYPGGTNIFYGPGAYTGSNIEFVLMGQASMKRIMTPKTFDGEKGVSEVTYAPHPRDDQGKIIHSRKPAIFRDLIVKLFGDVPRVEVFAREQTPGWHAIGDQLHQGQAIQPGIVIDPLPPPVGLDAWVRRRPGYTQAPLFELPPAN